MSFSQAEIVVRCLQCGVKNRIPMGKIQKNASCGACGASLEEIIIPCLHCGKKNRLGEKPLADRDMLEDLAPRCGACGKPLRDGDSTVPQG
jgi:thioredoxin 2